MLHRKVFVKSNISTYSLSPFANFTKLKNVTSLTLFYICEADQHGCYVFTKTRISPEIPDTEIRSLGGR